MATAGQTVQQAPAFGDTSKTAVRDLLNAAKPLITVALKAIDQAGPIINKSIVQGKKVWAKLAPYHPEDWLPCVFGIVLIFFGGQFPILIAAIEAFRICGWQRTQQCLGILWQQFQAAADASKKDDTVDANNDGIADVKQIDSKQLLSRKVALFFRTTDPKALDEGMQGVTAGLSAVVATLRLQFAQTVTLGVSLGDTFTRTADALLRPGIEAATPKEYQKWISLGIRTACRSVAITIAYWCQRVISAMHSATRGAALLVQGVLATAARYKVKLPIDLTDGHPMYPLVCGAIAGIGFWSQISRGFSLPFPLNILLIPVRTVEWLLWYFLAYGN